MKKIEKNSPEAQSADLRTENIAKLKAMFPEILTEGPHGAGINVDVLRQLVGEPVSDGEEKYGLNWHGKRRARQLALTPSTGTLRPCPQESVDWNETQNLVIEGDNLEVLKLLQKSYAGKVKLIYIDPPYNTGKDFVYPDNFQNSIQNYLELTGQMEGRAKITSNTEASGRFHTDWLNMLLPRLTLARSLLRQDGVVFISIDDRELTGLRMIANEVFGEERFVATITVVNNMKGRNDKKYVAATHEYVVVYAGPTFESNGLPLTTEQRAAFKYIDEKGNKYALRDLRKRGGPDRREDRENMFFPIFWDESAGRASLERQAPTDIEIAPLRGDGSEGCWRWGSEKVRQHLAWLHPKRSERTGRLDVDHRVYLDASLAVEDDIEVGEEDSDDDDEPIERTSKPKSVWLGGEFSSDSGMRALKALLPGKVFDFPKSIDFLRTCVLLGTKGDDIVLDLFSGSGAAAQAVMQQNAMDGERRRFICIQLPEPLDPSEKKQKVAAALCDKLGLPRKISELTKERIRRAGAKIKTDTPLFNGDTGFRAFKLDYSNIRAWQPNSDDLEQTLLEHQEHVVSGRSASDLQHEILLKLGLDLCVPIQERAIAGQLVQFIGGGVLVTCLSERLKLAEAMAVAESIPSWLNEMGTAGEVTCVFRDSAFDDDVTKTNVAAILQQADLRPNIDAIRVRSL